MQLINEIAKFFSRSIHHSNYRVLEVQRAFDVPVEQLFSAFKSAETLKKWWWPHELYTDGVQLDFREGGKYFINMKGKAPAGGEGMTGQFEEIESNKHIRMTDFFADKDGNAITAKKANMPGKWPKVVYIDFEFEAIDERSSRLTLHQEGIPDELQKDCIQGWSETFEKLESYLAGRKRHGVF